MKKILAELDLLVDKQVITAETASRIRSYYEVQESSSSARIVVVFSILGALLVGLGIILVVAHNWDTFPKLVRLGIAFLPLLVTHSVGGYLLVRNIESTAWREATSALIIFAVATAISLVSQIYNIHGELANFLLVWMALSAPVMYVFRSSVGSLLFIVGTTWYGSQSGYLHWNSGGSLLYFALLAADVPYYVRLIRTRPDSNFTTLHHWAMAISLSIVLGTFGHRAAEWNTTAYVALFGCFVLVGQFNEISRERILNGHMFVGSLGTIALLLGLSFKYFWSELSVSRDFYFGPTASYLAAILYVVDGVLLWRLMARQGIGYINAKSFIFLVFAVILFCGLFNAMAAQVLINVLLLVIAILTIREGILAGSRGQMNYGLLIMAALITCRFFDVDMTFAVRGLLFILVGSCFFIANYKMSKMKKF